MRIAYLDCFAGISGDMLLGALIDAGIDPKVLHETTAALNLNASLRIEKVDRSGISCTKVHVLEGGKLAEDKSAGHTHTHVHEPVGHVHEQQHAEHHTHQHKTGHAHDHSHDHTHDYPHEHTHGRSLTVIRTLIQDANLPAPVKQTAIKAFELLGASEAKIHNVDIERIHFHEVGAVDAIVDIVAASAGIHALNIGQWYCSALNVGGGMVDCAHGRFPVPAPATADLLRGLPTYSADIQKELITPTGAAIIRALEPIFSQQPSMRVEQIGYGAGTRNPKNFPNVLRISIGESTQASAESYDTVTILETAIDDLSPQILAHVTETALAKGALDVMCTSVQMKKGRLGTLITILADNVHAPALERLLLNETSTLGVRIHTENRSCLDRSHTSVATPYGDIRIKVGTLRGEELNAAPEFEDCRASAAAYDVPVKQVMQAATSAYFTAKRK